MSDSKGRHIDIPVRKERWSQPGVCACQKDDGPWHAHYPEGEHSCARCGCQKWRPSIRPVTDAMQAVTDAQYALSAAERALDEAWLQLGAAVDSKSDSQVEVWRVAEKRLADWVRDERRRGLV